MNLLSDPILTVSGGGKMSLAGLFAAMARGEARGFPALRPHQRPAWHMFLVQLGALALWTAGRDRPPTQETEWACALRGLTPSDPDDAPWRLVVAELDRPAFLQAPDPGGLKWNAVETPDSIDMLITARNHDLKRAVAGDAAPEDWVFALVSLQTCEGYGGRGNNGVARMNGGSSSRPLLGLAPARGGEMSVDPAAWWKRDVRRLLEARAGGEESGIGPAGGAALLWCLEWPEGQQLAMRELDPWFIEICRRVRLVESAGAMHARCSASDAPRIDAKAFRGVVGDPWAPVNRVEGKSLTLGSGNFDYKRICDLLFSGNWKRPLLSLAGDGETGDMLLIAEAFSRGNSKTEGFKSRIVPVPSKVASIFSSETVAMLSEEQMREIASFDKALRNALDLAAAGGERDAVKKGHYAFTRPARTRFDRVADRLFFPSLWRRVEARAEGDDAVFRSEYAFLAELRTAAEMELKTAIPAIPCPAMLRPKAETRAWRAFTGTLRREDACRSLFNLEYPDVAS